MLRSVRLRIYVYAHLNMRYVDYKSMASYVIWQAFASALLTMIKFIMRKRVRILDS